MRLHFLRLSFFGSVLLLLFMLTGETAGAYSGSPPSVNLAAIWAGPRHRTPVSFKTSALPSASSGTHFLYVDDGGGIPDSIDVYKIGTTLTHVGNFPTGGYINTAYYGATNIAVTTGCLVYGDQAGFVDSYPINSNGSLGTQVSHIALPGVPSDIHINKNTGTVYVNMPSTEIASYGIGSGCTLTAESSVRTFGYSFVTFGIAGNVLLAPDINSSTLATYTLGPGGTITALSTVTGQFANPDSVAVEQSNSLFYVFTGQATYGHPFTQGGKLNTSTGAITFLHGSPAFDPKGEGGAGVIFDKIHHILIQAEQSSYTLANYSTASGTLRFLNQTPMARSNRSPVTFAQLNTTLFVAILYGPLEACTLTSQGATRCKFAARLTNDGLETGMAIL